MSGMYSKTKGKMWTGSINITSTVCAVGVDSSTYIVDLASHEFLSDITATVTTPVTLTSKSTTNGKFSAANITLSTPSSTCNAVVIYVYTGTPATSPLICYLDDSDGLPSHPADGEIQLDWDSDLGIVSL